MTKTYTHDGLEFHVNEDGVLVSMVNKTGEIRDVVISRNPTSDCTIRSIGENFCNGIYKNVYISSSIEEVQAFAFVNSDIGHVHWSNNHKTIPQFCFDGSSIEKITGIEHVTKIEDSAFANSCIAHIDWPVNCTEIPRRCFYNSELLTIVGTGNVTKIGVQAFYNSLINSLTNVSKVKEIGEKAFACSAIADFKWPSMCKIIPKECFCESNLACITNIDDIDTIGKLAFAGTKNLKGIDLSNSTVSSIGKKAFSGMDPDNITLPYYFSAEYALV